MTKHPSTISTFKRGAASLYVVIFTTLLLSVITLSYVRIIVAEVSQTSNIDLSQSAYDSALAGIEDAKIAILRYHECLSSDSESANCQNIVQNMHADLNHEDCDTVSHALYQGEGEIIIEENSRYNESENLQQAYTCVTIAEELDDYRTTLDNGSRTRIIPIRTQYISNIKTIMIQWYTKANNNSSSELNYMSGGGFDFKSNNNDRAYVPPVLYAQLIQANDEFSPAEDFDSNNGDQTNRAEVFLYPKRTAPYNGVNIDTTSISAGQFARTADKAIDVSQFGNSGGDSSRVYSVNCLESFSNASDSVFACTALIGMPEPLGGIAVPGPDGPVGNRNSNATFLRIGLPYGTPATDISVSFYSEDSSELANYFSGRGSRITDYKAHLIQLQGVQAKIDSTGRANDLFRRIETRIELVDIYYPYPEFVIQSDGTSGNDGLYKDFYITRNCWYANDGDISSCINNSKTN